jgi:hypothetical protein
MFDGLASTVTESRFEDDLDDLSWQLTDLFHRKTSRVQRLLDDNKDRQRKPSRMAAKCAPSNSNADQKSCPVSAARPCSGSTVVDLTSTQSSPTLSC